jgi:hypothetical protein
MLTRLNYIILITLYLGISLEAVSAISTRAVVNGFMSEVTQPKQQSLKADISKQTVVNLDVNVAMNALVNGDFIDIQLFDEDYLISIDQTQSGSPGVITYLGSVYDRNHEKVTGNVLLTLGDGKIHGLISTPSGVYQLSPSNGGQSETYHLQKMKQIAAKGFTDFPDPEPNDNPPFLFETMASADFNPPAAMSSC